MPTYRIQLKDGSTKTIRAGAPLSEDDIDSIAQEENAKISTGKTLLSKAWELANKPLPDYGGKTTQEAVRRGVRIGIMTNPMAAPMVAPMAAIGRMVGGTAEDISTGALEGATDLVYSQTSPLGLATLGVAKMPVALGRAVAGAFGGAALKGAYDQAGELVKQAESGDVRGAVRSAVGAIGGVVMGAAGLKHAATRPKPATIQASESFKERPEPIQEPSLADLPPLPPRPDLEIRAVVPERDRPLGGVEVYTGAEPPLIKEPSLAVPAPEGRIEFRPARLPSRPLGGVEIYTGENFTPTASKPTKRPSGKSAKVLSGLKRSGEEGHVLLPQEELEALAARLRVSIDKIPIDEVIKQWVRLNLAKQGVTDQQAIEQVAADYTGKQAAPLRVMFAGMYDKQALATKHAGKAGGMLIDKMHLDELNAEQAREGATPLFNALEEASKQFESRERMLEAGRKVHEVRDKGLDPDTAGFTPQERAYYDAFVNFYDYWRDYLIERGRDVVENYAPRNTDIKKISQSLEGLEDIRNRKAWHNFNTIVDSHLKQRTGHQTEMLDYDLVNSAKAYMNNVPRAVEFQGNSLKYLHEGGFAMDIPRALVTRGTEPMAAMIYSILHPSRMQGKAIEIVRAARENFYKNALNWNYPVAWINRTQRDFVRSTALPDAENVFNAIQDMKPDEIGYALVETLREAHRRETAYAEVLPSELGTKDARSPNEPFAASERGNWNFAGGIPIIDSAMKDPRYAEKLKQYNGNKLDAINDILSDKSARELALRRARTIAGETQGSPTAAMRPPMFDNELFRTTIGMFKRFRFLQLQHVFDVFRSDRGSKSFRAQLTERINNPRGVDMVEQMREIEMKIQGLENLVAESNKRGKWDYSLSRDQVKAALKVYNEALDELSAALREVEPLRGKSKMDAVGLNKTRQRMLLNMAKVYGITLGTSITLDIIYGSLFGDKKQVAQTFGKSVARATVNALPIPFPQLNPSSATSVSMIPNFDYGPRAVVRGGLNFVPFVGMVNRLAGDPAGRLAAEIFK